jgi:hypothetical protein
MNRREFVKKSLSYAPATPGLALSDCGGGGSSASSNLSPTPPPCPAGTFATGQKFASSSHPAFTDTSLHFRARPDSEERVAPKDSFRGFEDR